MNSKPIEYKWEAALHLFKDKTIAKQLSIAIGLPFGILIAFLLYVYIKNPSSSILYALSMIALLFVATFLLLTFAYQNKMAVTYELNSKHMIMKMAEKQRKVNRWINISLAILSIFNKNVTTMGIFMLTSHNQKQTMRLDHIKKAKGFPEKYKIVVYDSYRSFILQCHPNNYSDIKNFIQQYTNLVQK